jgi:hypothetical protein
VMCVGGRSRSHDHDDRRGSGRYDSGNSRGG